MRQRAAVYKGLGGFGTLGLEIVLSILFGLFGGSYLDGRFGTEPVLMWIGFGLGVGTAIRAIQRALSLMRRETAREERAEGNPVPAFLSEKERDDRKRDLAWEEDARKARDRDDGDGSNEH